MSAPLVPGPFPAVPGPLPPLPGPFPATAGRFQAGAGAVRDVMIVGDSISQGREGDCTWRYRLWRILLERGTAVRFVGPWEGTWVPSAGGQDDRPADPAGLAHAGAYRQGIHFPGSRHYASWGRLLHEAKDNIGEAVAAHSPGCLMVALGFNDLAWGVSGPGRVLADMEAFVHRARAANPDIQFLVGNVVHRTPLSEHPRLPDDIISCNRELPSRLAALSTDRSRAVLVDLNEVYDPRHDTYDGVHPNDAGEIKIALAFAGVFTAEFGRAGVRDRIPALG
ncbi:GDSL-type esterase/lipase family protein [Sphaerisporangium perillae]|uniref:GDSL-type esterase/lipase family protein n=1 Tax=Sphaerisporangium perillae TaxID=2935860 RepID=UPI00200CEB83|nr:GDSL-type esterase/lipase family protein [Sphaerisporangium perillae]